MTDFELLKMRSNPFKYSASSEKWWKDNLKYLGNGYKPITTFFSDLSIAECCGHKAIKDTYKRIINEWGRDIKYITEFVICLNHKIWQLYEIDKSTAKVYNDLWFQSKEYVFKHFKGNDLIYYYKVVD